MNLLNLILSKNIFVSQGYCHRRTFFFFAINILLFIFSAYESFAQDFTINRFHADISINQDSSVTVKEHINVFFHSQKHGIYREIPYKYRDDFGKTIKTPLEITSIVDEQGRKIPYKVTKKGDVINIRIGDPDKYLSGDMTYIITYKVENAVLFFDDHDELYWNVTGNYWLAPIKDASAKVMLLVEEKTKNRWATCYTGHLGSRASECNFETFDNSAEFHIKRNLNFKEGFTIVFGWDKGLVNPPSSWKKFFWTLDLKENWIFLMPVLSLIIMINLWNKKGKDPKVKESITVRYEPPKYGETVLTPAEVGTLVDEKLDSRDITSTIVGLAVKGYLRIEEIKKEGLIFDSTDYYLAKLKEPDENLSRFEKILMERIFTGGTPGIMVSDMKNRFYKELELLKNTLYGDLVSKKYFLISPEKVRKFYLVCGVLVLIVGFIVVTVLTPSSAAKGIFTGFLSALPVLAFSRYMPAKTKVGANTYVDILGFQEFLTRAEKDRLERMADKELFSKFLPYAIALDVVDSWAKAFEGIYQDPPQWYTSERGFRIFSPYSFSRSINAVTSTLSSAIFSAPRSSGISRGSGGFSGGGFSGGGFGGGGGGSW